MRSAFTALFVVFFASSAIGAVPGIMNNQGLLRTEGDAPLADGQYDVKW